VILAISIRSNAASRVRRGIEPMCLTERASAGPAACTTDRCRRALVSDTHHLIWNWMPDNTTEFVVMDMARSLASLSFWMAQGDAATQNFQSESCWAGSGGGTSAYETYSSTFGTGTGPWTNFQYPLFGQSARRTPDISFDADPASGAWVRFNAAWYVVGGTSLSAPALAGIVNNSGNKLGVAPANGGYYTSAENNLLYAELLTAKERGTNFYDVTTGSNGASATVGWDYCTGVGSPRGKLGK